MHSEPGTSEGFSGAERRYHPRVPVQWPVVIYTSQHFGHGTVMDVSALAWRIRGSLLVYTGQQVGVRVWPDQASFLEIEAATVLWVRGQEFAIEIDRVRQEHESSMVQLQDKTMAKV